MGVILLAPEHEGSHLVWVAVPEEAETGGLGESPAQSLTISHLSGGWGGAAAPVWEAERTGTPFPREAGFSFSASEVGLEFQAPLTG